MVIKILGTSHISAKSISAIKKEIESNKPDVVAIELDLGRAQSLNSKEKTGIPWQILPKVGLVGFAFVIIGRFVQQHLGSIVGVEPGAEMKQAMICAHRAKARIVLIDRPIQLTLASLSKQFEFKEKMRMFWDFLSAPFTGKKRAEEMGITSFSLSGVPSENVILKMTDYIKKRYPGMYKALISERDIYMSKGLIQTYNKEMKKAEDNLKVEIDESFLDENHASSDSIKLEVKEPSVLAVVGAGHLSGMKNYLEKKGMPVEVVEY